MDILSFDVSSSPVNPALQQVKAHSHSGMTALVSLSPMQQQDLVSAGQLLLSVALQSPVAAQPENFHQSLDSFSSQFTSDLYHIIQYATHTHISCHSGHSLICSRYFLQSGSEGPPHSIVEVLSMIGGRVYHCMERVQLQRDWLEAELSKEVENGRLFRLLAKLGTITERPE